MMETWTLRHNQGLKAGGKSGKAIQGKSPDASLLFQRILAEDEDLRMPPDGPLSQVEIDSVRKWIELGTPCQAMKLP